MEDANRWTKVHRGKTYVYIFPQKRVAPQDNPIRILVLLDISFFKYFADSEHPQLPQRELFTKKSNAIYQMITLSFSGRYIAPEVIPNALWKVSILRRVMFTRLQPSECTSVLVRRAISSSRTV